MKGYNEIFEIYAKQTRKFVKIWWTFCFSLWGKTVVNEDSASTTDKKTTKDWKPIIKIIILKKLISINKRRSNATNFIQASTKHKTFRLIVRGQSVLIMASIFLPFFIIRLLSYSSALRLIHTVDVLKVIIASL